jgi:hypothetical protein
VIKDIKDTWFDEEGKGLMDNVMKGFQDIYNNYTKTRIEEIFVNVLKEQFKFILNNLNEIYGIEFLEYHNKNLLSGDNKSRCEEKLFLLKDCIDRIENIKIK